MVAGLPSHRTGSRKLRDHTSIWRICLESRGKVLSGS